MLATVADLEAALGRPIEDGEVIRAERALRYASNLAGTKKPAGADWDPVPEPVTDAVAALAARRFNSRADGLVAIGPFRYGEAYKVGFFTAEELAMLGVPKGASSTVSLATPDEES